LVVELVQLFLARHDGVGEVLQHPGAFVEGHVPQRRPADIARVVQHRLEVEAPAAGGGDHLARDRALDLGKAARTWYQPSWA
jgi:hypothetical protein